MTATLVHCVGDEPAAGGPVQSEGGTSDVVTPGDGQPAGSGTIALAKSRLWIPQGADRSVPFTITRGTASGALVVHANGLPAGVTAGWPPFPSSSTAVRRSAEPAI